MVHVQYWFILQVIIASVSLTLIQGCVGMIEGMKGTGGTTNNLLVYFAGYKKTAKLIRLIKNGKGEVKQETVMSYDKHNSVSLDVMKDVFRTAFSNYPAKSYGIVFGLMAMGGCIIRTPQLVGGDRIQAMEIIE